jgi:hypothetical protein
MRAWLDDPMSTQPFADDRNAPRARLVPTSPRDQRTDRKPTLPQELTQVPEIRFQQPLTKALGTPVAQLHTAVTIDGVNLLNQKKTDAFIETLKSNRRDLAGLDFAMGHACRLTAEAGRNFAGALELFRTAASEDPKKVVLMDRYAKLATEKQIAPAARVASLMQVLGHESSDARLDLVKYLEGLLHADSTRALARLAVFSPEPEIHKAALEALKKRDAKDATEILTAGLNYPWPAVAERAAEAIVKLERKDLIPALIDALDHPDPRAPQRREINGKEATVVREVVRLNHHHSCLLCHAPAPAPRAGVPIEESTKRAGLTGLTAQVPVPSESMVAYYAPSVPDILVRIDVTYLRQDFSMKLPVADADPWPEMQRYDFLVRTREVSTEEAAAVDELLRPRGPEALSPYRRAALVALRGLTGLDAEPSAAAWRKRIGQ